MLVRQMVQIKNKISTLLMEAGVSYNKQRLHKAGYFRELLATNQEIDEGLCSLLRYLWCQAAMHAARQDPELKRFYRRKLLQKGLGKARVAAARKLGIRLWIMLRDKIDYNEFCRRGQRRQENGGCLCGDA
jgi:transposase